MRGRLVRLYPAGWRARYGDEFLALLEERPLGPFDVADILLGAVDAQLRLRNVGSVATTGRSPSMSLRMGGYAAILGGAALTLGIIFGLGLAGDSPPEVPAILLLGGSLAVVVALIGLSAFQARAHPVLSWAAVAITAAGLVVMIIGIGGMQLLIDDDGYWDIMVVGFIGALLGSALFAVATYRTATLSRSAAAVLGTSSVAIIPFGYLGDRVPILLAATGVVFGLSWLALGVVAVRLDRPATASRPT
jgi:hypothetical protein